jgi:hypothetical protein
MGLYDTVNLYLYSCFIFSYTFFYICNKLVIHKLPRPKEYIESAKNEEQKLYRVKRWKNIVVSFIHAMITSIGGLYVLNKYSELHENMIEVHVSEVYIVNCFVFTYFFYDTVDNLMNNRTRKTYEMMIHHAVVLTCYFIQFVIKRYLGCITIILLLEVNSVFLHFRHILLHYNVNKKSIMYQVTAFLNVITLIIFRLYVIIWMLHWVYHNYHLLQGYVLYISTTGLLIFLVMNTILLYRVIVSDYLKPNKNDNKFD